MLPLGGSLTNQVSNVLKELDNQLRNQMVVILIKRASRAQNHQSPSSLTPVKLEMTVVATLDLKSKLKPLYSAPIPCGV